MSLSRTLLTLPPEEQDRALRTLARKMINENEAMSMREFLKWTHRHILHAMYAAGVSREAYNSYRNRIRYAFRCEKEGKPFIPFVDRTGKACNDSI